MTELFDNELMKLKASKECSVVEWVNVSFLWKAEPVD